MRKQIRLFAFRAGSLNVIRQRLEMTLTGKTALVTGSTSGIGLGIVELLAKAGANIVLNGMGDVAQIEAAPWEAKFDPVMGVVLHE